MKLDQAPNEPRRRGRRAHHGDAQRPQSQRAGWRANTARAADLARRREPLGSIGKKLEFIQKAAQHDYPVGDIDGTLAEIEAGYGTGARS